MAKAELKKPHHLAFTDSEWERAKTLARASGRSVSGYFTSLLDLRVPRPLPPEEYRLIYRELSAIGNNINQMAKLSHGTGSTEYVRFEKDLKVIYALRKKLMELSIGDEDLKDGIT